MKALTISSVLYKLALTKKFLTTLPTFESSYTIMRIEMVFVAFFVLEKFSTYFTFDNFWVFQVFTQSSHV